MRSAPRLAPALLLVALTAAFVVGCSTLPLPSDPSATGSAGWGAVIADAQRADSSAARPSTPGRTAPPNRTATPSRTSTARPTTNPAAPAAPAGRIVSELTRVSIADRSDGRGYVIRLHATGPVPAYVVEDAEPGQVRLRLFQTGLRPDLRRTSTRGPIQDLALSTDARGAVLTITLDPALRAEARAYPDRDSDDMLLALSLRAAPLETAPMVAGGGRPPVALSGSGSERWRLDCVVLDAGHGGRDPGAQAHGVRESDVTLAITQRVGRMIEDQLGIRVVYTRTDDRFIELAERGRIANQSCGKLFVSIHANAAENRNAYGTETYFLGMHRSESARRVMERENGVVALESDPNLYAGMDEAGLVMQTMALSTYLRTSEQLAGLIENQFTNRAQRHSRGVKQAGFLVLWRASMPAVLIEVGFITNREEARYLASSTGQQAIAESIFQAIREYKLQYERGLHMAAN